MTTKKLSEGTGQKIVNPNPIEVITLLDHYRLAILFKVYLYIQVATRNVQRTFKGGYLNYMDVFLCGNLKQIKIYLI